MLLLWNCYGIKCPRQPKLSLENVSTPMNNTHSSSTNSKYPSLCHSLRQLQEPVSSPLTLGRHKFQGITCPRSHKESGVQQDKETFPIQETTQPPSFLRPGGRTTSSQHGMSVLSLDFRSYISCFFMKSVVLKLSLWITRGHQDLNGGPQIVISSPSHPVTTPFTTAHPTFKPPYLPPASQSHDKVTTCSTN